MLTALTKTLTRWWTTLGPGEASPSRPWPPHASWPWPVRQSLARRWPEAARANYLASASPTAASLSEKWASHCIGIGPTARASHPDDAMRRALESVWTKWSTKCDLEGIDDLIGVLNLIIRTIVASGEIFVRMVTTKRGELRLQILSPEQIDPARNEELSGGGKIVAGIEFNAAGERVAYHVFPDAPDMMFAMIGPSVRVPASEIIHVFERKLPGQPRGTSWLGPLATRLLQLDTLEDALLARAQTGALFGGFLTDPEGAFTQDGTMGAAATRTNASGDIELSLEPGTLRRLPPGTSITFPVVPDSNGSIDLLRHISRSIASGGGLPYELLTGDLSDANYSSARLSLQSFQRRVRALQQSMLGNRLLLQIWQRLVTLEVLSGRLYARDFERRADDYFAVSFLWPEWPSIDPLKDAKADVLEVNAGLKSRQELIAARGRDVDEVNAEIEDDEIRPDIATVATATLIEPSMGDNQS